MVLLIVKIRAILGVIVACGRRRISGCRFSLILRWRKATARNTSAFAG